MSPNYYVVEPNPGESQMSYWARFNNLVQRLADRVISKNVRPEPDKGHTVIIDGPVDRRDEERFGLKPF